MKCMTHANTGHTLENSQPLTALLCRRKSAVMPYALLEQVMPRICGWPCARSAH